MPFSKMRPGRRCRRPLGTVCNHAPRPTKISSSRSWRDKRSTTRLFVERPEYKRALFRDHGSPRCYRRRRRGRRDCECEPHVPAVRPIFAVEFPVAFEIEIALHIADRKQISDLRANANHARLEAPDTVAGTAVARQLIVKVTDGADKNLLRQILRSSPVDVKVDAVLIIRTRIYPNCR